MKFRNAFKYDADKASRESGLKCDDDSLAVQSEKDEADINVLVRRFGITGMMPQNIRPPTYVDYDEVFDFRTAMNAIQSAEASFMAMPAEVRARFANDPAVFVDFCSDPANLDEMRKLGLAVAPAADAAEPVIPAPPSSPIS